MYGCCGCTWSHSAHVVVGVVMYCMDRCQPSLSIVSRPPCDFMKEHVDYVWSESDKAFNDIKWSITHSPILKFFDPKSDTIIQSDASMNGLGCTFIHAETPVWYASHALIETESRYSNIDRQCGLYNTSTTTLKATMLDYRLITNHL